MTRDDLDNLDLSEQVKQAIYDFLENGKPHVNTFQHKGSYQERVLLALNEIMGGKGVGSILVNWEVLAQYIEGPEPTIVYDVRTGDYWVMQASNWTKF